MQRFNFSNNLLEAFKEAVFLYENDTDVFAIDIGFRYDGPKRLDDHCVRVHFDSYNGQSSNNDLIYFFDYTNLNLHKRRKVLPLNSERRQRRQIIQPGISIGMSRSVGTLGLICYDNLSNRPCLLTAEHVIPGNVGKIVLQPAFGLDRGIILRDGIAKKLRADSNGDAAIATLRGNRKVIPEQFETKNIIESFRDVKLGETLTKSGRTTNVTPALVDGIGVYYKSMRYGRRAIKGFRLVPIDDHNSDNIQISDEGDSGSIWFDFKTNEGVGLLFAGETEDVKASHEFCWAQHLSDIMINLKISIYK
ncbi:hypothetical protein [Flagellimonas sp. 2504JD4-2]